MKLDGFIGPAYTLKSVNVDCQNCINLYLEINEIGKGKDAEIAWLRSTSGLKLLFSIGDGPIRLIHVDGVGRIFIVSGAFLYQVTYVVLTGAWKILQLSAPFNGNFTADPASNNCTSTKHHLITGTELTLTTTGTLPGGLATSTDYWAIFVDDNTFQLASSLSNANAGVAIDITDAGAGIQTVNIFQGSASQLQSSTGPMAAASSQLGFTGSVSSTVFVDGVTSYCFLDDGSSPSFGTFAAFGFAGAPTPRQIIVVDGYFLYCSNTAYLWCSQLDGLEVDPLSFAASEGDPDNLIAIISSQRNVWLLNERSTELFNDTGNVDFPFERVSGGFIEKGILAPLSVAKIEGNVFWLARDEFGHGMVYLGQGLVPQRISTHAIETAIQGYATPSDAVAFTYQSGGHSFYVLNFDEATWVYDLTTGMWHERAYLNNGVLERHRAQFHAFIPALGIHMVGDYSNTNIYQFDDNTYTDNGSPIARIRTSPHVSNLPNRIFYNQFQLDMETGVGLDGGVFGSDPQVVMQFSKDSGRTWSNENFKSAGKIGLPKSRVIWRRLGQSRDLVFRIKITDPVKVALISAQIDIESGAN